MNKNGGGTKWGLSGVSVSGGMLVGVCVSEISVMF